MKSLRISCILIIGVFLSITLKGQGNGSVGIGIEDPNPNAILHLVSPGNNQGLLIPTMTASQRTSSLFTAKLNSTDNGLLVFDLTEKTFYFWQDNNWQALSAGNQSLQYDEVTQILKLSGGNAIDLSTLAVTDWNDLQNTPADFLDGTDEVDDADADPLNEIQDLSISGTLLRISNNENATTIDLGSLAGTDSQDLIFSSGVLSLSGDPDATLVDLSGYDSDFTDDFDGQFSSLSGVPEELLDGDQTDDADSDPNNEIQSLQLEGEVLTLSGDLSGTNLDFTGWDKDVSDDFDGQFSSLNNVPEDLLDGDQVDDADADPLNEIQLITTDDTPGNITLSNDKTLVLNVDDADADDTNELQSITRTENDLILSNGGGTVSILDADADPLNEIQLMTTDETPGNITLSKDKTLALNVDDADASVTNEIQTLTVDNTIPGNLTLSDGGTVVLNVDDADADPDNELQDLTFVDGILSLSDDPTTSTLIDFSNYDNNVSDDFDGSWNSLTDLPEGFDDGIDDVDDADANATNEIQNLAYNISNNQLSIRLGSTVINSVFLNDLKEWSVAADVASYSGNYANANNFISTPSDRIIQEDDLSTNTLLSSLINFSKVMAVFVPNGATLSNIEDGVNGQELTLINVGDGNLIVSDGGNLHLSTTSHSLSNGDNITFIYYTYTIGITTYKGWTEKSSTISN